MYFASILKNLHLQKKELQINKMLQNDANFAITNGKRKREINKNNLNFK